jgi:transposase
MAQKTVDMNQIKQVRQLKQDGVPIKEIARRTGISRKTVKKYLRKMELIDEDDNQSLPANDKELAAVVYNSDDTVIRGKRFEALLAHFEQARKELHKTGVTKQLLWIEYCQQQEDPYRYSQYCYLFRKYLKDTDPAFHWEYTPGEFIQCDFAGKKLSYVDRQTGEVISCEVFVGVLPFSGLIFCICVLSQRTADLAHCINELVKYVGGITKTFLLDNLKTAVKRADKYEPVFTDLCDQLAEHYNTTFSATRPMSPRDKAMVENAVNIVYTHIYAHLRNNVFHSIESLNHHIRPLLDALNHKSYKNSSESRMDIFMRQELPILKELPSRPYQVKKGKQVTVQSNYAIQLSDNGHYYTVPYQYVGCKVWVSYDSRTVEVFYQNERISLHVRSSNEPKFNRIHEHMPPNHQHMVELRGWTVEQLLQKAGWVGEYTRQAADRLLHSSIYPEQNYKACHAMIRLQDPYGKDRLEAACRRAANVPRPTLKMIRNILEAGLDKQPLLFDEEQDEEEQLPDQENIRGSDNYK